jgi:hypothetical protein
MTAAPKASRKIVPEVTVFHPLLTDPTGQWPARRYVLEECGKYLTGFGFWGTLQWGDLEDAVLFKSDWQMDTERYEKTHPCAKWKLVYLADGTQEVEK